MLKVGVTGGIGSGKSTVCKIFECLGVPVFRADEAGRDLISGDKEVKKQLVTLFGESVMDNHGNPDRQKIASIVFNDPEKLNRLNAIIHPCVRDAFATWADRQNTPLVIEEAAIVFESGLYKILDAVIVVAAPENIRIKRVMERDKTSEVSVRKRMKNQLTEEERISRADFVINNDEEQLLIPQALEIFKKLSSGQFNRKS